jgi:hypothetical protein
MVVACGAWLGTTVNTHDLAPIVNPESIGQDSAGEIDGAEPALGKRKTMNALAAANYNCSAVKPYDLTTIVDIGGLGRSRTGEIDRGK